MKRKGGRVIEDRWMPGDTRPTPEWQHRS